MIEYKNVFIKYIKGFYTLYDFNFTIADNENILIIGDEDDGTHAILRILAKIDSGYTGEVSVDNTNIKNINDKNLNMVYIPFHTALFENKIIQKNLSYPLRIRKIKNKDIAEKIENLLKKLKISINLQQKVKNLSQSQKKIITLLRSALREPKYILIENAFKNLSDEDKITAGKIIKYMSDNRTVIATATPESIAECYNGYKIIKLEHGSIQTNG